MQVWWVFRCDQNHAWEVYVEDGREPQGELTRCPIDGTEAVTASRQEPADRVRIALIPAARIADPVTGTLSHEQDYYLEIGSVDDTDRRRSANSYSWDEAVRKATLFRTASWQDAVRRWERTGMGTPR
jgi:hypothetical protein